jgi:hypothetical protein
MKILHSDSLILMWRLAECEARHLSASSIEPPHLLLALCKSVDLDLPALVQKDLPDRNEVLEELLREVRRLRTIFRTTNLDVRTFRRALRWKIYTNPNKGLEHQRLRRSIAAKRVFVDAERLAEITNSRVFPVQLLDAVLSTEDEVRDDLFIQQGVKTSHLKKIVRSEIIPSRNVNLDCHGLN